MGSLFKCIQVRAVCVDDIWEGSRKILGDVGKGG